MKITLWKFTLLSLLCAISFTAHAEWKCNVADGGGHVWSSEGATQDHANTVAYSFCTAYSPISSTCHLSNCVVE